ncbi:MAG TPA: GC-type dockerin domain-anchored protein [Phycisphaerales bacterium]|nr:GC-type dockerin domain-anchored protein [Phycisphaerales bacterium]
MFTRSAWCRVLFIALVFALATGASAQVARLGAVGDSLSDEYFEQSYAYAKNWTMQLVEYRAVDMGPTAQAAGRPGGTWGEPRRTGYEYNWARYGADSGSLLAEGQHTGLAAQAGPVGGGGGRGVTHAVVAIGANDFSPTTNAYFSLYWGLWSQSQIDSYVAAQVADVNAAVQALDAAGLKLVLGNYVDFGIAPVTRQIYTNASRRERITAVIAKVNEEIELIARRRHLVLLNLNAMGTTIFGTNSSLRQYLAIGNVNIQLFNRDTASHSNPLAGFVDDGAHPHTSVQGVFANAVMTALNTGWGASYPLFSDQEILSHAGIAYGGAETLAAHVGPYSQYVRTFRCPGDYNGDGHLAVVDIFEYLNAWFAGNPGTDVDGVPGLQVADIFAFLNAWFAGCP